MTEYIERKRAIVDACNSLELYPSEYAKLEDALNKIPAADVAPVRHGRWVQVMRWSNKAKYRCSVCGREIMSATKVNIEKYPYCHCGAKMDLEE